MNWSYYMPTRIVFGQGVLEELPRFVTGDKVLLVTGKSAMKKLGVTDRVMDLLDDVIVFDEVEENPSHQTVDKGVQVIHENDCKSVVALGGGSPMDTAKLIALIAVNGGTCADYVWEKKKPEKRGLPFIAVPTTSGTASEVTSFSVISDYDKKLKGGTGHPFMYPDVALIDPELTLSMPKNVTANTGVDALSHAVESYWAKKSDPISSYYALEAIRLIFENLERACAQPDDLNAREEMSRASLFAGLAFGNTGVTAAHSVSHTLTAFFGIAHGNGCAINLPWLMDYYKDSLRVHDIARMMGADSVEEGEKKVWELMRATGMVTRLGQVGMKEEDIPKIVEGASRSSVMQNGPREISEEIVEKALKELI